MSKPVEDGKLTRRVALTRIVGLGAAVAVGAVAISATPASAWSSQTQVGWRFCNKCFGMIFIDGGAWNNCPAGGQHVAQGWTFQLPYNYSTTGGGEDANDQANWRRCVLCSNLFWTTPSSWTAGVCPTGGQHDCIDNNYQIGLQYLLPHDIGAAAGTQQWRFCFRCNSLYFDGYQPNRGVCPAGWGHAAAGYLFAIPVYSY
jgi:hypothetical protein